MQYTYPSYYSSFRCTGSACPDTCCAGWNIAIDRKSLKKYRNAARKRFSLFPKRTTRNAASFSKKLARSIDFRHGTFRLSGRRCPFLDRQNLCEIYQNLGKDSLCGTCRIYPRHQEEYGNLREISLSLSCPEAAGIILKNPDRPAFLTRQTSRTCPPEEQVDEALLSFLLSGRSTVLELLWRPSGIPMALAFTHDLQRRIRLSQTAPEDVSRLSGRYLDPEAPHRFLAQLQNKQAAAPSYRTERHSDRHTEQHSEQHSEQHPDQHSEQHSDRHTKQLRWLTGCIRLFASLEPVADQWTDWMRHLKRAVSAASQTELDAFFTQPWTQEERNILAYFITVSYPGAVYDENVFGNMQLSLVSLLMIRALSVFLPMPLEKAAYLYSREVENSDANLTALADAFQSSPLYAFRSLLELTARI